MRAQRVKLIADVVKRADAPISHALSSCRFCTNTPSKGGYFESNRGYVPEVTFKVTLQSHQVRPYPPRA